MSHPDALSAHFRQVTPYVPGLQPAQKDGLIKLNTNENPYPPSKAVREVLTKTDADSLRLYPSPDAEPLRSALADYLHIKTEQVFVSNGSDETLALAFLTFFADGSPVWFPAVTYSFYEVWASLYGIPFETKVPDEQMRIRPEDFYGAPGGVVFPNPNAPTGVLMSAEDVEKILKANREVAVIVDEAYIDFGGRSVLPLIDRYDNLLVVQTFSKSRALAGLRIGYAAGSADLIRRLNDVKYSFNSYTMNRLSVETGCAALKDNHYFHQTTEKIIATRERLSRALTALDFTGPVSSANFLFVRHPGIDAKTLYEALKGANIFVRHFDTPATRDYLRITIGTDGETDALIRFLTDYVPEHTQT